MLAGRQANERSMRSLEGHQQLLPGIPDEITWHQIIPKLPWKAFHTLSLVSRAWRHRIRTRQVYDARVVSHSTETLVIMDYTKIGHYGCTTIGLYSKKDNSVTELPPIPYWGDWYQWVSLDGKIYLLAAEKQTTNWRTDLPNGSSKVFVCDVAEQRQWKECASMNEPRTKFGCGVIEGKIYVFGGLSFRPGREGPFLRDPNTFCGSEVYDPKEDRWSLIRPMTSLRFDHRILTVGDELFVLDGTVFAQHRFNAGFLDHTRFAKVLEVYNPVKDEWRVVSPFGRDSSDLLFEARGKLYSMDWSSIYVYNAEDNSWTHLHSVWFPVTGPADSVHDGRLEFVLAIDDELLVRSCWWEDMHTFKWGDFQSKGFGSGKEEIMWQKSQFQIPYAKFRSNSNRLIQL